MAKLSKMQLLDAKFASLYIRQDQTKQMILISIDFGTTFSCIATARIPDRDLHDEDGEPIEVSKVKVQGRYLVFGIEQKMSEVPSVLAYDKTTGEPYFGLEVKAAIAQKKLDANDGLELIKLLLKPEKIPTEELNAMNSKIGKIRRKDSRVRRHGKVEPSVKQLISDCLRRLWINALWNLEKQYTAEAVKASAIHAVLCIPAIWEQRERSIMTDAALLAGLPEPYFVSEPEGAAGLYFAETEDDIEEGDVFLTCDAGGGTVDLITYKVSQTNPLRLREAVGGDGALCGSSYINADFREALPTLLSDVLDGILEDMNMTKDSFFDMAVKAFETAKRTFDGFNEFQDDVYLEIPGLKPRRANRVKLYNNLLALKKDTVARTFEITTKQVHNLVRKQIYRSHEVLCGTTHQPVPERGAKIKFIVMVGGFGESPHLQASLKKEFQTDQAMGYQIPIVCPSDPSKSIVSGAILRATNRSLISDRCCRMSIGFIRHEEYDPKVHKSGKPKFDPLDGIEYAENRIHWLVKLNEMIPRKGFVRHLDSRRTVPIKNSSFHFKQVLYGSRTQNVDGVNIKSRVEGTDIHSLGVLEAEMSEFPDIEKFEPYESETGGTNLQYYDFSYRLRITVESLDMKYEMMIPPLGKFPNGEEGSWDTESWFRKEATLNIRPYLRSGSE